MRTNLTHITKANAFDLMKEVVLDDNIDLFSRVAHLKSIIKLAELKIRNEVVPDLSDWPEYESTVIMDFNT